MLSAITSIDRYKWCKYLGKKLYSLGPINFRGYNFSLSILGRGYALSRGCQLDNGEVLPRDLDSLDISGVCSDSRKDPVLYSPY